MSAFRRVLQQQLKAPGKKGKRWYCANEVLRKGSFRYELTHQSTKSRARVGIIHTPHGQIDTPNFVGVGTHATMKSLTSRETRETGLQLMFCNTYHLLLHPGPGVIQEAGGLHRFMNYDGPIITDSGGFQVFSLMYGSVQAELKASGRAPPAAESSVLRIDEDGVLFRSYRDGAKVLLTPENSVQCQKAYGSDIIIPLDELRMWITSVAPYHMGPDALRRSLDRTHRWELRSLQEHLRSPKGQAMYCVVHGGVDKDLRRASVELLAREPFDGFAIGGSLGKTREEMVDMLDHVMDIVPRDKPNHLLGIGDLKSIDLCLPMGFDTFDSAFPTRAARHGTVLTKYSAIFGHYFYRATKKSLMPNRQGTMSITSGKFVSAHRPIEDDCRCYTCLNHTMAYVHHLFKAKETWANVNANDWRYPVLSISTNLAQPERSAQS